MAGRGKDRASENRRIRQEALREQLSKQKHIEHVVDIADKMSDLSVVLEPNDVSRLRSAADIKLKLINKYLPDVKAVEITGSDEEDAPPLKIEFSVKEAKGKIKTTNAKS